MGDDADRPPEGEPKAPFTAGRTISAWGAVIGGLIATFRGATGDLGPVFLIGGPVLVVLGVVAFVLFAGWRGAASSAAGVHPVATDPAAVGATAARA